MRKEIPLLITALVGVVLILQYFSPNKSINSVESTFMDWAQIVFAFSMILGILNLIRVNGDKIYKKRKNWGLSVIIIISLFTTAIVGFANVGGEAMYDKKILKTNFPVVENIAMQVLNEAKIPKGEKYNSYLIALIEGTQKEKTISSLLPENLKDSEAKYVEMLTKVKERASKGITIANQMGRDLKKEVKSTLKNMNNDKFKASISKVYDDVNSSVQHFNKEFSLDNKKTIKANIEAQVSYVLKNSELNPSSEGFLYYKKTRDILNNLNEFLLNDKILFSMFEDDLKSSKDYNAFYNKMRSVIELKKSDKLERLVISNVSNIYLNEIYRIKDNFSKEKLKDLVENKISEKIANNKNVVTALTGFIVSELSAEFSKKYTNYINNDKDYLKGNKLLISNILVKIVYTDVVGKIFSIEKSGIDKLVSSHLKARRQYRKLITSKKIIKYIAVNKTSELKEIGLEEKNATFLISILLVSGKYKLNTLEIGSSFMKIYEYVYVPLQATMFALLAFFVASASYRAFRARNKEATLLLIAGFIVMLGRVPVGEYFSIDGYLSFSQMSQFIMSVPAMSVQSGIMIGVALGVISTSLRLILGIERSHLGGD